jgi:glycine/D-amino acid oxidase-like deaminating enzyme
MLKAKNWTLEQWITWVKGIPPPPGDPSDPDNWQTELMAALHYWETLGLDYDRNEVVPCSPLGARRLLLPQIEAKSNEEEDDATMVEEEEEEEVSQRLGPSFVLLMPQQQEEDMSPRLNHPTDLHAQRRARIREEQQQQDEELERRDYVFVDVEQSTLTLPPLEPPTQPEPDLMDVTAIP